MVPSCGTRKLGTAGAASAAPAEPLRQKSPLGTNLETVSCPAMVVNTWFNAVIGTACEHTVPLATEASGTE